MGMERCWGVRLSISQESRDGSAHGCQRETVHNNSSVTDPWESKGCCEEPGSWAIALRLLTRSSPQAVLSPQLAGSPVLSLSLPRGQPATIYSSRSQSELS